MAYMKAKICNLYSSDNKTPWSQVLGIAHGTEGCFSTQQQYF